MPRLVNDATGVPHRGLELNRLLGWSKRFSLSLFLLEREMKTDHEPGGQGWARALCRL